MESLEDRIAAALSRLKASEPDCEQHMFVFPINLMRGTFRLDDGEARVVGDDIASVARRD